ncbi:MAG: aspartyl-phosphate phosphatase Spo0E family protein [Clostridia bacterium]
MTDKRLLWERILALRSDLYKAAVHNSSLTSEQVLMMSAELDQLILAYMASGPQAQGAST